MHSNDKDATDVDITEVLLGGLLGLALGMLLIRAARSQAKEKVAGEFADALESALPDER